jgi:hypothetical protein
VKIKLLINAIAKKIPETTLIFVVALDFSKLIPKVNINVTAINTKLPAPKSILFSLS